MPCDTIKGPGRIIKGSGTALLRVAAAADGIVEAGAEPEPGADEADDNGDDDDDNEDVTMGSRVLFQVRVVVVVVVEGGGGGEPHNNNDEEVDAEKEEFLVSVILSCVYVRLFGPSV